MRPEMLKPPIRNIVSGISPVFVVGVERKTLRTGAARRDLALGFLFQIVMFVFGFPEAALKPELVEQSAVYFERGRLGTRERVFGDQRPVELASALFKQVLESAAHRHLVVDIELAVLTERLVIRFDRCMSRLEIQLLHWDSRYDRLHRFAK